MGLHLSLLSKSGEIPWFYLHSLGRLKCWRLFRSTHRQMSRGNSQFQRSSSDFAIQQTTAMFESIGVQAGDSNPNDDSSPKKQSDLKTVEHEQTQNEEMALNDETENLEQVSTIACDKLEERVGSSEDTTPECSEIYFCENASYCRLSPDYENDGALNEQHYDNFMDHLGRRVSFLSPVKEESDWEDMSSEEEQHPNHEVRLNADTFPVFEEDADAVPRALSRHVLARCKTRPYRRKVYCSVSSDSGIGEAMHVGSSSSASTSSVCVSTSDSSDCSTDSSTHSCDLTRAAHSELEEDCCSEGAANDVFSHGSSRAEEPPRGESPGEMEDAVATSRQAEVDSLGWASSQQKPIDQMGAPKARSRPILAPLNFRARRKVTFSFELPSNEDHLEASASHESCSSPSSPESTSSSLKKSFRPIFSRQDSDESTSSVSSGDSILALPLSPESPAAPSDLPFFVFPDFRDDVHHCFSEDREGCDLVLLAQGERFHVHSAVVAWQCSALLQHLQQTGASEVMLVDRRPEDVVTLLHLLYPFQRQPINEGNVWSLVELAHYLGCARVLRMCNTFLTGLAHLPHLCPHPRPVSPSPHHRHHYHHLRHSAAAAASSSSSCLLHSSALQQGRSPTSAQLATTSNLCSCADTMVERALDILVLAVSHDLDEVYHTYLDVTARIKASDLTACPRFKHMSAVVRQDVLMSRLSRLESTVDHLSLQESDLRTCRHQRHDGERLTYSGPLCLKCSSRSLLRQATHSLG